MISMMHTISERLQAYLGGFPNHPGAPAQTCDPKMGLEVW